MPLNKPLYIDGVPLNGTTGVEVWLSRGGDPYAIEETVRRRAGDYPALDSVALSERRLPLDVKVGAGWSGTAAEFDSYVRGLFRVSGAERTITSERDGIQYTLSVRVAEFDRARVGHWTGEILVLEPEWLGPPVGPTDANPLEVAGNTDARPVIRFTDGAPALRRRYNISDRSGEGLASWPLVADVRADELAAENYEVYFNGAPLPYWYRDGYVYCRVAAQAGVASFVDIISSAEIDNSAFLQPTTDGYDEGGLLLDPTLATGPATVDPAAPWSHPKSAALSFHPGIAGKHNQTRPYTFGFDSDGALRLIDPERTGRSWSLENDADAYILTSPVEMATIEGLVIEAFAGFRAGRGSAKGGMRCLKVTIQDANGNLANGPQETHSYVRALRSLTGVERNPAYSYYAIFNMGGISFPDTKVYREYQDIPSGLGTWYSGTVYRDDYLPTEFGSLAARYIGCPVTTGGNGVWYLWFPADAYGGGEVPRPSMTIQPKNGRLIAKTILQPPEVFVDYQYGTAALDNVLIMNSEWVDPVTKEPLGTAADDTPQSDLTGRIRVDVVYWTRDSEQPRVAAEWILTGAADASEIPAQPNVTKANATGGIAYTITPGTLAIPGAVKVAVRVSSAATAPDQIDWGTAAITQPVVITFNGAQRPAVTQVDIQGQYLDGVLRNLATGEYIRLGRVYSDANGLEIDTARKAIRGVGGIGMVYGEIRPSGGNRWFDLPVGDVAWEAHDGLADATVEFEYRPRLIGNS